VGVLGSTPFRVFALGPFSCSPTRLARFFIKERRLRLFLLIEALPPHRLARLSSVLFARTCNFLPPGLPSGGFLVYAPSVSFSLPRYRLEDCSRGGRCVSAPPLPPFHGLPLTPPPPQRDFFFRNCLWSNPSAFEVLLASFRIFPFFPSVLFSKLRGLP